MNRDFKELLAAFNAARVRYLIVGGYAVSFHAQPRATKDLDIFVGADSENSKAVYAALVKFGAPVEGLSAKDFSEPENFFRMGAPPVMVDIMPRIIGVEFEEAWVRRVEVRVDSDLSASFISREDLLSSKLSAARAQDLADVDALRESGWSQGSENRNELDEIRQEARESGLQQREQREQRAPLPTLEEIRAKGREEWLDLRRAHTPADFSDPKKRLAQRATDVEPKSEGSVPGEAIDEDTD